MAKIIEKTFYPDPNEEVEKWKDALYEEIKDLPPDKIGEYLERKSDGILKKYNIYIKPFTE